MNRGWNRGLPRELPTFRGLSISGPLRSIYFGENQSGQVSGADMVVLGDGAGGNSLRGSTQSVIIGSGAALALADNSTANVLIGYQAAVSLTSTANVAIGYQANLTGGGNSVIVGSGSFSSGNGGVAIGQGAGIGSSTTAAVAVGQGAFANAGAVSVGPQAGHSQSGTPVNTFVGFQSGWTPSGTNATTTGTRQTCIGNNTGANTTTQLTDIVCVGDAAVTGGNSSVAIGSAAVGFTNAISIGKGVTVSASGAIAIGVDSAGTAATSTVANEIVLGTTLHGLKLGSLAGVTSATTGFPYMPVTAGAPSGVPASKANYVPFQFDSTNGKLWAFYGAAWHFAAFT